MYTILTGLATKGLADLLHLLGAHIVSVHNEALWVLIKQLLKKKKLNPIT